VRSLRDLATQNLGFRKDGVLLMDTDLRKQPGTDAERQQLAQSLEERLAAIPGVDSVSRSDVTPISGTSWQWDVAPETSADAGKVHVYGNLIAPNFFRTLGTPLIAGRDFTAQDTGAAPLVAIVNQAAAQRMFPGLDPIGRTYHQVMPKGQPSIRIVGLAGDAKYRHLRDAAPPTIYIPISQNTYSRFPVIGTFEMHFAGPAASIERQAGSAAESLVPQLSLEFQLLSVQVNDSLRQERLIAGLASAFGILAQLLACIGIYGVMAYSVSRRTQEIGVRMALGARRLDVIRMVMRESLLLVGAGIAIGVPVALGASFLVRNMLYGVRPVDPLALGLTVAIMIGTAALAAFKPAARASRTDPALALRSE
jgi:predicted permease